MVQNAIPIIAWQGTFKKKGKDFTFIPDFLLKKTSEGLKYDTKEVLKKIERNDFCIEQNELLTKINSSTFRQIIVDDRILSNGLTSHVLKDRKLYTETLQTFKDIRLALVSNLKFHLTSVEPLELGYEPLQTYDKNIYLTLLRFSPEKQDKIAFKYQYGEKRDFEIEPEELMPEDSIDPWYYLVEFRELRKKIRTWNNSEYLKDLFSIHRSKKRIVDDIDSDVKGGRPVWISSQQISLDLMSIDCKLIDQAITDEEDQFILEEGDILISLARRTDVKIARYEKNVFGRAVTSQYISVLRTKKQSDVMNSNELMARMTSSEFLDQIRMHLSDRLYKPIIEKNLNDLIIPPMKFTSKSNIRCAPEIFCAISRLIGGRPEDRKKHYKALAEIWKKPLEVSGPIEISESIQEIRLRRKLLSAADFPKKGYVIVGSDKNDIERVHKAIKKTIKDKSHKIKTINIHSSRKRFFSNRLDDFVDNKLVLMLTNSQVPLRSTGEYDTYRKILKIVDADHVFVLVDPPGKKTNFPGRQLIAHIFGDDLEGKKIRCIEFKIGDKELNGLKLIENSLVPASMPEALEELVGYIEKDDLLSRYVRPLRNMIQQRLRVSTVSFYTHDPINSVDENVMEFCRRFKMLIDRGIKVILIEGETGTGKGFFCKKILKEPAPIMVGMHLDEQLVISQLFGHRKGAFTGADADKEGYVTIAEKNKCPLILDEINSYPSSVQWRLLRLLDEGKYEVLGEPGKELSFSQTCICLSNETIKKLTDEKPPRFRKDLAARLGPPLVIPPLRKRPDDFKLYLEKFIRKETGYKHQEELRLHEDVFKFLNNYSWPGNVRELEILVRHLIAFTKNEFKVSLDDFFKMFPSYHPFEIKSQNNTPEEFKILEEELRKGTKHKEIQNKINMCKGKPTIVRTDNLKKWAMVPSRKEYIEKHKDQLPLSAKYISKT